KIVVCIVVSLLVGLGLGYSIPHGATPVSQPKEQKVGGLYETNPVSYGNITIDPNTSSITQTSGTALFSDLIQNAGIVTYSTSTTITTTSFCTGGMFVIPSTAPVAVTLTLPSLANIASSVCGSSIFAGSWNQNLVINKSVFPL